MGLRGSSMSSVVRFAPRSRTGGLDRICPRHNVKPQDRHLGPTKMSSTGAPQVSVPFCAVCMAAVFTVVILWVPFHSGRRPLALFDQFAAFGIIGVLAACSVGAQGVGLWLPGSLGLVFGLLSYLLANRILLQVGPPQRSASALAVIALAFLGCGSATLLSFKLSNWLLPS